MTWQEMIEVTLVSSGANLARADADLYPPALRWRVYLRKLEEYLR